MSSDTADTGSALAAFQRDFAAALLDPDAAAPGELAGQPGFAVYRNTVAAACIDALAANFPTVHALVGGEWFDAAAAIFCHAEPPRDPRLVLYGAGFADFLAAFAPAQELPYLAGVARFDRLWTEAHVAADAVALGAGALASLDPGVLAAARIVPHPAARWLWCAEAPAFTIWRRHREGADPGADLRWHGEGGLVVRPRDAVAWQALGRGGVAFLDACAAGISFGEAAERADAFGAPIGELLPGLVAAGAFSAVLR